MNYENLKKSLDGYATCYASLSSGERILTDGHIMCLVPTDFSHEETVDSGRRATRITGMVKLWEKSTAEVDGICLTPVSGLVGHMYEFDPYRRKLSSGQGWTVHINEKYYRAFDAEAEWFGTANDKILTVRENGVVVGLVMPMRWDQGYQPAETPSDEELYKQPPPSEDDDEEEDCPRCGGSGKVSA